MSWAIWSDVIPERRRFSTSSSRHTSLLSSTVHTSHRTLNPTIYERAIPANVLVLPGWSD